PGPDPAPAAAALPPAIESPCDAGSHRPGGDLVRGLPLLDHPARGGACLRRPQAGGFDRMPGRPGEPEPDSPHPARAGGDGDRPPRLLRHLRLDDRLGERTLRPLLGQPPSPARGPHGARRPGRESRTGAGRGARHSRRDVSRRLLPAAEHLVQPGDGRPGGGHRARRSPEHPLYAQPDPLRLQPLSAAAARRQLGAADLHAAGYRRALPRLPPPADVLAPRHGAGLEPLRTGLPARPHPGPEPALSRGGLPMRRAGGVAAVLILGALALGAGPAPDPPLLLAGARLLDPQGERLLDGAEVLVERGKIAAIGPAGTLHLPAGGERLDLAGLTLIPGLIELHSHLLLHPYDETPWDDQVLKEPLELRTIRGVVAARATLEAG